MIPKHCAKCSGTIIKEHAIGGVIISCLNCSKVYLDQSTWVSVERMPLFSGVAKEYERMVEEWKNIA